MSLTPQQGSLFDADESRSRLQADSEGTNGVNDTEGGDHLPPSAEPARYNFVTDVPHDPEQSPAQDSEWSAFIREQGRVPRIEDTRKPWEYRGWLMYYRVLLEDHLDIPKRWDFWYRTMAAGHLLDEPIPEIRFIGIGERSEGYKLVDQWVRIVDRSGEGTSSPMTILLDWLLWGFGLTRERPHLPTRLNEELYRAVNIGPLLLQPYDYLGEWIALQKGRWNPNAFYPTPHEVVELMTAINFSGMPERVKRSDKIADPCMGTGRMLLHASNHSLRLYGTDIDGQVIRTAKVNGALYCPWLVRPFPGAFFETSTNPGLAHGHPGVQKAPKE